MPAAKRLFRDKVDLKCQTKLIHLTFWIISRLGVVNESKIHGIFNQPGVIQEGTRGQGIPAPQSGISATLQQEFVQVIC